MTQTAAKSPRAAKRARAEHQAAPARHKRPVARAGMKLVSIEPDAGVGKYVQLYSAATPMEIVELERAGVRGGFLKALSREMAIPSSRMFEILGVPRATAEKKAAANEIVAGRGGQAAIGMVKLLGLARGIVESSTAKEAGDFDSARWLGEWIERPQASLGGRKPADLLDTPTGLDVVGRLLGAIASGSYQ